MTAAIPRRIPTFLYGADCAVIVEVSPWLHCADFSAPVAQALQVASPKRSTEFIHPWYAPPVHCADEAGRRHGDRFARPGPRPQTHPRRVGPRSDKVRPPRRRAELTARAAQNLQRAKELAETEGAAQVEERHLLTAILQDEPESFTLRVFRDLGVDVVALRPGGPAGTPILDRVGRDLTALAREGKLDPLIGRHAHLRQLVRTLARKKKNNPVLVGHAGVGKTAIVEGLAALIAAGQIPDELKDCRLVELPMAALVAGTTYRGQFEERLLGLVKEVKAAANVILFIDEIHTILRPVRSRAVRWTPATS